MNWTEISIHTTSEATEAVSNLLHEAGASGVVIEDPQDLVTVWDTSFGEVYQLNPDDYPDEGVIIKAYFPLSDDLNDKMKAIYTSMEKLADFGLNCGKKTMTLNQVNEEDWASAWKQYYKPVNVSDRFTIKPTWEEYELTRADELVIELDPGMAFGTGTHPTTMLCIRALEETVKKEDRVIDVGTGTGVLSIASALLGAQSVEAYDLDDVAVKSAIENVKLNRLQHKISVRKNNLLHNVAATADVVVANLLTDIVKKLAKSVPNVLKKDGFFVVSGIITEKQREVEEELHANRFSVKKVLEMDGWVAIISQYTG